jgi:hypothetical protein
VSVTHNSIEYEGGYLQLQHSFMCEQKRKEKKTLQIQEGCLQQQGHFKYMQECLYQQDSFMFDVQKDKRQPAPARHS